MTKPKRRRRAGRSRKTGYRHPSGKIVQPTDNERQERAVAVATEARMRLFGVTMGVAQLPEAGDILGRLCLNREISRDQYDAGKAYMRIMADYRLAMMSRGVPSPGDFSRTHGHDDSDGTDPEYQRRCNRAIARHDECRKALLTCVDPLAQMVLDAIVLEDRMMQSRGGYNFIGTLRVALNAVARVTQKRELA